MREELPYSWTHVVLEPVFCVSGIFPPSYGIAVESGFLSGKERGGQHTSVEFDILALVLLDRLFDSNQFSVRIRFLEFPCMIPLSSAKGQHERTRLSNYPSTSDGLCQVQRYIWYRSSMTFRDSVQVGAKLT